MQSQESAIDYTESRSSRLSESSRRSHITHGSFYEQTRPHPNPEEDRLRRPFEYPRTMILDGGVILQLAVLFLLKELLLVIVEVEVAEDNKVQSSADSPLMRWSQIDDGFRLCHYFDYICGMSYGGISAVLLGRRRATIDEALTTVQQISERQIQKLLHESPSPSPHMWGPMSLLRYFKQLLGFESDAKRDVCTKTNSSAKGVMDGFDGSAKFESNFGMCRTLVLTSHGDSIHRNTPYMLRSYEILSPDDRGLKNADQPTHNFTLLDVCCALLASRNRPCEVDTPGIQGPFCDASFEGYSVQDEVKQEITALHSGITEQLEYKLWNEDKKPTGTRSWFSASEPKTAAQESLGDIYLDQSRLKLPGLIQEPKCDPSGMSQRIEATIKKYCATDDVRRILRGWAQKMVASRKHRAGFQRWETFAFGVCYRCCICEDEGRNSGFMDVDTWGSHMANKHETPPFTVEGKCRVMP